MDAEKELDAMRKIAGVLGDFGDDSKARARVLRWAAELYGVGSIGDAPPVGVPTSPEAQRSEEEEGFDDLADLFDAAGPQTDADRALVVGYWLTVREGKGDFTSRSVNSELKNLGYGVTNITSAFSSLMRRKPALAMQTAKTGTSRQARKRYKLTRAGHEAVRYMLQAERESEN